jgi:hypothetical protein
MALSKPTMADEIQEYKAQLADVEALLQESPHDASLHSLKSDLIELLLVSGVTLHNTSSPSRTDPAVADPEHHMPETEVTAAAASSWADNALDQALMNAVGSSIGHGEIASTMLPVLAIPEPIVPVAPAAKKKKVKAEFEIPKHLEISESDTTAEKNKKKRAIKALKFKWKESVKEVESEKKQKSWQSFQKKRKDKGDSIFKTGDTAVGVVSAAGRKLTDFEDRKRHKHAL